MSSDRKKKKKKDSRGLLIDAYVGGKDKPSFESWLRTFKRRYTLDQSDYRDFRGSADDTRVGRVDPVAAYRFQRLTARDMIRFEPFYRQLALLGYDLGSYEGIDRFWKMKQPERDRLYYVLQDPDRFKAQVEQDFFGEFKRYFKDFQKMFAEFFEHVQEEDPSFDPEDLKAHYKFMGLKPKDGVARVKERYRILAFKYHPDHGGDETRMKALNIAYAAVLRDALGRG